MNLKSDTKIPAQPLAMPYIRCVILPMLVSIMTGVDTFIVSKKSRKLLSIFIRRAVCTNAHYARLRDAEKWLRRVIGPAPLQSGKMPG
jgi:hypothetical protein